MEQRFALFQNWFKRRWRLIFAIAVPLLLLLFVLDQNSWRPRYFEIGLADNGVDISTDGRTVWTSDHPGVKQWNRRTGRLEATYVIDRSQVASDSKVARIAVSPDRTLLAINIETELHIVGMPSGKLLKVLSGAGHNSQALRFSPDGTRLLCVDEGELRSWDTQTWQVSWPVSGAYHESLVALSPDADLMAVLPVPKYYGDRRSIFKVFQTRTGQKLSSFDVPSSINLGRPVAVCALKPMVVFQAQKELHIWEAKTGKVQTIQIPQETLPSGAPMFYNSPQKFALSADGRYLSEGRFLWEIFNPKFPRKLANAPLEYGDYKFLEFSSNSQVLCGALSPRLILWRVQ